MEQWPSPDATVFLIALAAFLGDRTQELVSFTDLAMSEKYAEAVMAMRGCSAVVVQNNLLGEE